MPRILPPLQRMWAEKDGTMTKTEARRVWLSGLPHIPLRTLLTKLKHIKRAEGLQIIATGRLAMELTLIFREN